MNLYGFASGDPVNFSDPFGLCGRKGEEPCPTADDVRDQQRAAQGLYNMVTEFILGYFGGKLIDAAASAGVSTAEEAAGTTAARATANAAPADAPETRSGGGPRGRGRSVHRDQRSTTNQSTCPTDAKRSPSKCSVCIPWSLRRNQLPFSSVRRRCRSVGRYNRCRESATPWQPGAWNTDGSVCNLSGDTSDDRRATETLTYTGWRCEEARTDDRGRSQSIR